MLPFRIGTRGSPLALVQAGMVRDALFAAHGWTAETVALVVIRTTGDRVQDRPLAEIGGKALWTRELDRALLDGEIDCAVHSMKDVETFRPDAITIAAMLPRADVRDRLVGAPSFVALRPGATIGTSSPRRAAQVRAIRPDLVPVALRGNVDTRLAKLAAGEVDATLLAAAGLARLGRHDVGIAISTDQLLPAPAQGAIGIECRAGDRSANRHLAAISCAATMTCVGSERAFLAALHADCHAPAAALAQLQDGVPRLQAQLLSVDGGESVAGQAAGESPAELAERMLARAPTAIRTAFGR